MLLDSRGIAGNTPAVVRITSPDSVTQHLNILTVVSSEIGQTHQVVVVVAGREKRHVGGRFREIRVVSEQAGYGEEVIGLSVTLPLDFAFVLENPVRQLSYNFV